MLRFFCRFLGIWSFAAALVFGLVDGAKSIAASGVVTTPLAETLAMLGGSQGAEAPASTPWPLGPTLDWLLAVPVAIVLLALGIMLLAIGRRRRQPRIGREFAI